MKLEVDSRIGNLIRHLLKWLIVIEKVITCLITQTLQLSIELKLLLLCT